MTIATCIYVLEQSMKAVRRVTEEARNFHVTRLYWYEKYLVYKRWHNRTLPVYLRIPKAKKRKRKE
jgi:hypothetical protein